MIGTLQQELKRAKRDADTHEYEGHDSWGHWNVALWAANDEGWYRDVLRLSQTSFVAAYKGIQTPDGATCTPDRLEQAWEGVHDD